MLCVRLRGAEEASKTSDRGFDSHLTHHLTKETKMTQS